MGIFIFIVFAAVAIALVVADYFARARRRAALEALARRRGWRFDPREDAEFPNSHARFGLFADGRQRRIYYTLAGRAETRHGVLEFLVGDYRYTTGSGEDEHIHRLSYLYARLPFPLPAGAALFVRPEHFGDTFEAALGFDDIDFESAEFSRRFYVQSGDRRFAYDVIHPRMIEYLLASPCGRLELLGSWLTLCSSDERLWGPAEIEATVEWLRAFVDLWPDYLVKDLGGRCARNN